MDIRIIIQQVLLGTSGRLCDNINYCSNVESKILPRLRSFSLLIAIKSIDNNNVYTG